MAAQPDSVRLFRNAVLRWLGERQWGGDDLAAAVALATSEAVANVVRHAYGREQGRVELEASATDDELLIRVTDRGLGLSPRSGARTGLGLPVIGRVSSGVTVASDKEGTTVSMRFVPEPGQSRSRRSAVRRRAQLISIG
jgi:anti-sigma regulatory factor (Ser/Thr protein kinase)